jgi:hypothetical protein
MKSVGGHSRPLLRSDREHYASLHASEPVADLP